MLAALLVYGNSFQGPFVFDDETSIPRQCVHSASLAALVNLLPAQRGETVTGRPLLNFTLAVNYAISGADVWSYHAANLLIHVASSLLLFGIVRRTFLLPSMRDRWGHAALALAFVVLLVWAVHPLLTESVTYTVQRRRILDGHVLSAYALLRDPRSERRVRFLPAGPLHGTSRRRRRAWSAWPPRK